MEAREWSENAITGASRDCSACAGSTTQTPHPGAEKTTVRCLGEWRYRNSWDDDHALLGSMRRMTTAFPYCKLLHASVNCKCLIFSLKLEELKQTFWTLHAGDKRRYMMQPAKGMSSAFVPCCLPLRIRISWIAMGTHRCLKQLAAMCSVCTISWMQCEPCYELQQAQAVNALGYHLFSRLPKTKAIILFGIYLKQQRIQIAARGSMIRLCILQHEKNMAVAIECWSCNEKQRRTNSIWSSDSKSLFRGIYCSSVNKQSRSTGFVRGPSVLVLWRGLWW